MFRKLKNLFLPIAKNSDGYHTFEELYAHRSALFLELMIENRRISWWSYKNSDGSEYPEWCICGIGYRKGSQVSYHMETTSLTFSKLVAYQIKKLDQAPLFDGHKSPDVLERLHRRVYSMEE